MSTNNEDKLILGGHEFTSRFILGSGKFSLDLVKACIEKADAQIITLALRRANEGGLANILDYIPKNVTLLPNTSGARNAEEAVRIARLSREIGCGDFVKIEEKYNIPLILITLGKDGSRAYYKDMKVEAAPFLQEHTIETTGAGDTFCASSLNYILEHGLDDLTEENLKELLTFANAAASLITTRKGALRVMSTKEEVLDFMKSRGC